MARRQRTTEPTLFDNQILEKRCARCKAVKPADAYRPFPRNRCGLASYCRDCEAAFKSESAADRRLAAETATEKPCLICGVVLLMENFAPDKRYLDRRSPDCRCCHEAKLAREWSEKNVGLTASSPKRCSRCNLEKPRTEFHNDTDRRDGKQRHCKACSAVVVERAKSTPEGREKFRRYTRHSALGKRYGITLEQYDAILLAQGGVCWICGKNRQDNGQDLDTDHDWDTGDIRGILCKSCNKGIGSFYHNPALLRKAAEYIEKTKDNPAIKRS